MPVKLPMFVQPDVCGPCAATGRHCCIAYPGAASPEDFGAPDVRVMFTRIGDALRSGRWALDWWEGEPFQRRQELRNDVFFMAPAVRGEEGSVMYPGTMDDFRNPCTFLSASGCELEHDARPLECRALEPTPPKCTPHAGGRKERAIEWWQYQGVIARVRETL